MEEKNQAIEENNQAITEKNQAIAKLKREWDDCGGLGGGKAAVNGPIMNMLCGFCEQDAEFAALICASEKKLCDVLKEVHGAVQSGWSDFAVYKRAIEAYCPGAKISIYMELDLVGDGAEGVAFGRDGAVHRDVYGKVDPPKKKAEEKKPGEKKPEAKGKAEKAGKKAKVLPPPAVGDEKAGTSADMNKPEEKKPEANKVIRFNFMDLL